MTQDLGDLSFIEQAPKKTSGLPPDWRRSMT
jgi:hypothetical protein